MPPVSSTNPPLRDQLQAWLAVGLQSFGGGMATLALIRRGFVEERAWLDEDDFTRFWAICQLAPGINLIAFAILIGRRLGGAGGAAAALAGMLMPSAAITVVMTAAYAAIRDGLYVKAALRAVIPATVGLGIATAIKMAVPLLATARREGTSSLAAALVILLSSGVAVGAGVASIVPLLIGSGIAGAVLHVVLGSGEQPTTEGEGAE